MGWMLRQQLFKQLKELALLVVGKDVKQMVMPKVDLLPLSYGKCGGHEGGAQLK